MAGNSTAQGPGGTTFRVEDIGSSILADVQKVHVGALGVDGGPAAFQIQGIPQVNTTYLAADIDVNGVVVVTGPVIVYAVQVNQASGGNLWAFLYDATTTQPNASIPTIIAGVLPNNATTRLDVGAPLFGVSFSNGLVLQLSGSAANFSVAGATLARGWVIHS